MKIDLHVHTSEVSLCGHLKAGEVIRLYKNAGYDAIVITNHFSPYTAGYYAEHGRPDFNRFYHEAFDEAEKTGRKYGLTVLLGYELHFNDSSNDYLVYGMPRDFCEDHKKIFELNAVKFGALAREHGFLFYQAHPFRNGMSITEPSALFGIEVKNAHPRHDSRNDIAELWAKKFNLHRIGGSDCHRPQDVGRSGIETPENVRSVDDLVRVLQNDLYSIF